MKEIWNSSHPSPRKSTILDSDSNSDIMLDCLKIFQYDMVKSLIIIGPPGCGKTNWAKKNAPKPALFVSHLDRLAEFDANYHKSIIFDDMDFQHMPRQAQIHIVDIDNPRDIHIRYKVANIPAKTIKIFTANTYPFISDPAITRRVMKFDVNHQLINSFI